MSSTRALPPARFLIVAPQEGILQRVSGRTSGAMALQASKSAAGFQVRTLDFVQINPAPEQPRLVYNSGGQPIIRWGWRRFVRTFMASSPRFQGRWFYAGLIQNQFVNRARVTGVATRIGTTYETPRFVSGTRAIRLGMK